MVENMIFNTCHPFLKSITLSLVDTISSIVLNTWCRVPALPMVQPPISQSLKTVVVWPPDARVICTAFTTGDRDSLLGGG